MRYQHVSLVSRRSTERMSLLAGSMMPNAEKTVESIKL